MVCKDLLMDIGTEELSHWDQWYNYSTGGDNGRNGCRWTMEDQRYTLGGGNGH